MTSESGSAALQRIIDKSQARRMVAALLDGSGLAIRQRKHELVISNPRDPEQGRVYVEYASGHVCWERPVCEHWGPLQGYTDEDDNVGHVGADRIIEALTGRPHPAGDSS